ncbi:MAG: transposase [Micromonosporaceae bacterium]|nr:transposase [Micromonosporaceae bacterium]
MALTQPSGARAVATSAAATSATAWLTLAVVDDAGRLLDVIDITDDPTGYAVLGAVLAQRSAGSADVAVAADDAQHQVTMLLAAAGRPLAVAEREDIDDFAERFGDDDSPEEMSAPPSERRAVGLARALQAGAMGAAVQAAPRELMALKPVLGAHAAVASGRQSAAVALREVLRELYPAALRAYPDPCEPVPLAVLDALPEPGMLLGGGDASVMAELTAARVGDPDQIGEAITALRVAIAETPRRTSIGSSATGAVAQTIRQSVAAVRACDVAVTALVALLTEKATPVQAHNDAVRGATVRAATARAATARAATRGSDPARAASRETAPPRETASTAPAPERTRGGRAAMVTPIRPLRDAGTAPGQNGNPAQSTGAHAAQATGANGNGASAGQPGRRSRSQPYPNEKVPAQRPSPEVAAPGSRTDWPLANSGAYDEVTAWQQAGRPAAAGGPAAAGTTAGPAATSYGPLNVPPTVLDTGRPAQPAPPPGRVPPPWQDDQLPPEPPALHLVEPAPLTDRDPLGGYRPLGGNGAPAPDETMRLHGGFGTPSPQDDPLGDGYIPPPLRLVTDTAADDNDSDLLIFAEAKSAWFTGDAEAESTLEWSNPADEGWQAAERLTEPVRGEETSAGLPRRVPQANLVPGSAFPPANTRNLRVVRDPAAIAAHTTGYFRGSRRAGEVHGFAVGGRPGRESASGWDFSRDGWESDHDEGYEYRSAARR